MNNLIEEVCFSRADNPELAESIDRFYNFSEEKKKDFYHVVYIDYQTGPCFIFQRRFSNPLEIPPVNFRQRLNDLPSTSFDELCFLLATYATEKETNPNSFITLDELTPELRKILEPTKGYLLFKEQGFEFYKLFTGCDNVEAWQWVDDVQNYKKSALESFRELGINGKPFADLFTPREYGPRFKTKPNRAAYELFKYLNPDKMIMDGLIHIRHFEMENHEIEYKQELIPVKFMVDAADNYRLGLHLSNATLDLDEYVEFGLHSDYCSNPKLLPMGCHIQHMAEDEFIVDGDLVEQNGDAVDYVSFPFHARIKGQLPIGIEEKINVFKLY